MYDPYCKVKAEMKQRESLHMRAPL